VEGFALPPVAGVLGLRALVVSVVQLTKTTAAARTDGEAVWITPRPAWLQIPDGASRVVFTAAGATDRGRAGPVSTPLVISGARARRLVAFINRLPVTQPGLVSCPAAFAESVTLRFEAADGGTLAQAVEQPTGCASVSLTIGGRAGPPLADDPSVTSELERLGAIPVCAASQLAPSATLAAGEAAQLTFTNASLSVCRLSGFARLVLLGASGRVVAAHVTDEGASLVDHEGLAAATSLDPGQSASADLSWSACHARRVVRVRVALPGIRGVFTVVVGSARRPFAPCGGRVGLGRL
jgi:hypothetical protein